MKATNFEQMLNKAIPFPGGITEDASSPDCNTKIEFLYRDASNYKMQTTVVVRGAMTEQGVREIMDSLDSGTYFIPSQVGLDGERFSDETEDDHPWFELYETSFSLTANTPTSELSFEELVEKFKAAADNWQPEF